jgi:hypothetical protein
MPGDPYRRVSPGQPLTIPAAAWNELMRRLDPSGQRQPGQPGLDVGSHFVRVRSSSTAPRHGYMQLTTPLVDFANNPDEFLTAGPVFTAIQATPSTPPPLQKIVMLPYGLRANVVTHGQIMGIAKAIVQLPNTYRYVIPALSTEYFVGNDLAGFPILYQSADRGDGKAWCLIDLRAKTPPEQAGGTIRWNSTATAIPDATLQYVEWTSSSLYVFNPGSLISVSGSSITYGPGVWQVEARVNVSAPTASGTLTMWLENDTAGYEPTAPITWDFAGATGSVCLGFCGTHISGNAEVKLRFQLSGTAMGSKPWKHISISLNRLGGFPFANP